MKVEPCVPATPGTPDTVIPGGITVGGVDVLEAQRKGDRQCTFSTGSSRLGWIWEIVLVRVRFG